MPQSIFISYNPNSDLEQTLAVRLYTLGGVHGYNMLLPDRTGSERTISRETLRRIQSSEYFILFSTTPLSNVVQEEINAAYRKLKDKSKILVIYDLKVGENLVAKENFTKVYIDRTWPSEKILEKILGELKKKENKSDGFLSVLSAVLLTGVALFTLSSIFDEPDRRKKPKSNARKNKRPIKKVRSHA